MKERWKKKSNSIVFATRSKHPQSTNSNISTTSSVQAEFEPAGIRDILNPQPPQTNITDEKGLHLTMHVRFSFEARSKDLLPNDYFDKAPLRSTSRVPEFRISIVTSPPSDSTYWC